MGKIWVEVCLISARGLRRSSSLWKLQWFAVGWIDPADKYCTKMDSNANPEWRTKFASLLDLENDSKELQVEIYSRDPFFLRERLEGTATVALKEFLSKYKSNSCKNQEEQVVGSYQLRKRNSNKPLGFVDVSIRVSQQREEPTTSYHPLAASNNEEEHVLADPRINGQWSGAAPFHHPVNQSQINSTNLHPMPNYSAIGAGVGPSYHEPVARPGYYQPPPPPTNSGYIPSLLPRTDDGRGTYLNMPTSSSAGAGQGPRAPAAAGRGFAMGVGAGAVVAGGALMFGDDFMSGFDIPRGLPDPSLTDLPF